MDKRIERMIECLTTCVEGQLSHLENVNTQELGEAIDMIKDLEEARYYCTITNAMTKQDKEQKVYYPIYMRDIDRDYGRMYYEEDYPKDKEHWDNRQMRMDPQRYENMGHEKWPMEHDGKEGRSPHSRRMYMESKAQHTDKATQMKELENYMQELTQDIVEMIEGATQEEKQYLSKRVAALANKIQQAND